MNFITKISVLYRSHETDLDFALTCTSTNQWVFTFQFGRRITQRIFEVYLYRGGIMEKCEKKNKHNRHFLRGSEHILPCSKRSENIINRKIRQFYIETISKKKSQLPKKIYFFRVQKKIKKNLEKSKNIKFQKSICMNLISNFKGVSSYIKL